MLNQNDLFDLERDFKPLGNYDNESKKVIIHRIGILLSKVKFIGPDNHFLDRREAIQVAFIYICENWTDDFLINSDWIFKLADTSDLNNAEFNFTISLDHLKQKMINIQLPNI